MTDLLQTLRRQFQELIQLTKDQEKLERLLNHIELFESKVSSQEDIDWDELAEICKTILSFSN
ncbi:MAG: hypothetical protein R2774_07165 [Saprospiraceae bacterium]